MLDSKPMTPRRVGFSLAVALFALALPCASAKEKKGGAAKAKKPLLVKQAEPQADVRAVSELMGLFKWGISPEDLQGILGKQIDKRYMLQVRATTDVYQQDGLRKKGEEEKQRIRDSFVAFDGQKTGWDVSIIDKEFGQKDDESMLVYWENDPETKKDQRRFFFFIDGKLWKMFIAFNSELFKGKTYADFQKIMEVRYGKAAPGPDGDVSFIYWRAPGMYLRAIDLTQFYGNFCVSISDDAVETTVAERREQRNPKVELRNTLIESVTEGKDSAKPSLDDASSDVVDRLTGKH